MGRGLQDLFPYIQQMQQQFGQLMGPLQGAMSWPGNGVGQTPNQSDGGNPMGGSWSNWLSGLQGGATPSTANIPADVYETKHELVTVLEIPGLTSATDVALSVSRDHIVIKGQIERKYGTGAGITLHTSERKVGSFERVVPMPSPVRQSGAHAHYANGLLEIRLVKDGPSRAEQGSSVPIKFH